MEEPSGSDLVHAAGSVGDERERESDALWRELDAGGDYGVGSRREIDGEFDDAP